MKKLIISILILTGITLIIYFKTKSINSTSFAEIQATNTILPETTPDPRLTLTESVSCPVPTPQILE